MLAAGGAGAKELNWLSSFLFMLWLLIAIQYWFDHRRN